MPRPTDVVFRNFNELTRIDREDILPRLPYIPYYPKKFLVHFIEKIPDGRCDYWLLESGKTLRIPLIIRPSRTLSSFQGLRTPPHTPQKSRSPSIYSLKSLSFSKLFKNSPSESIPSPPISPTKSFCYPSTPRSCLSQWKFWKKKTIFTDYEDPELDTTTYDDAGSHFERMMWKAERSTKQPLSPSQRLIDPEDEGGDTDDEEDLMKVSSSNSPSSQNRPPHHTFVSFKQRLRAVSFSSLPLVEEGSYFPPFPFTTQRTTTAAVKEAKPKPPPIIMVKKDTKLKRPPNEHICSFLNYRADSKFNTVVLDSVELYFLFFFVLPWIITEFFLDSFSWIPFFRKLADYIIANGGGTLLLLLSAFGTGLASLPLYFIIFLLWPFERLHELIIHIFRCMSWYKFRDSLGCPIVHN